MQFLGQDPLKEGVFLCFLHPPFCSGGIDTIAAAHLDLEAQTHALRMAEQAAWGAWCRGDGGAITAP